MLEVPVTAVADAVVGKRARARPATNKPPGLITFFIALKLSLIVSSCW
jgi:hypothetical protein